MCLTSTVLGCAPDLPPIDAEGERVVVGVQGQVELCAGTLRAWDNHVAYIEAELGIVRDPQDPLEVYVVDDTEPWCRDVMACYIGGWADATFVPAYAPDAVWHELVHHVVSGSDLGMTDRFLSEGLAGSLGDRWCPSPGQQWPEPPLLSLVAQRDIQYEHYPRAAQFVDWVRQEHGTAALVQLVECVDRGDPLQKVEQCVERILGDDIAAVGDHFADSAPAPHGNPALCGGEPVPWMGARWEVELSLGCGDVEVLNGFGSHHDRHHAVLVDLPRAGNYGFSLEGDGEVRLEVEPCFCPGAEGLLHVPGERSFWVGEPGRHRLIFRTEDPGTTRVSVRLWPLDEPQGVPG